MDELFAKVVDHIALGGREGSSLLASLTAVQGKSPRPGVLHFLHRQFVTRGERFCAKPSFAAPAEEVIIIAHEAIRQRALGFSPLEQPPLPRQGLQILERVGMARSDGILQSEIGQYVGLAPNMVHHYLGGLIARSLVARKKVVLTKRRAKGGIKHQPTESSLSQPEQLKPYGTTANKSVTYTAVVVLIRFAPVISQSSASRPVVTLNGSENPEITSSSAAAEQTQDPTRAQSVIDLTMETRVYRAMQALRPEPHIRSEKDLKVIAMPDSDRAQGVSEEYFRRRRHRCYRALRAKLERAGLVEVVHRECRARNGKAVGNQACLKLTELGIQKLRKRKDGRLLAEDFDASQSSKKRDAHPLLRDGIHTRLVEEVGVMEQVYQLLRKAEKGGISIPEMEQYLDGETKLTGLPGKRIRRLVDEIAKFDPITESQRFEGSAMYLRIALSSFVSSEKLNDPNDRASDQGNKPGNRGSKRRKAGITSLGHRRQQIVLKLLEERKVILLEPLGREVAVLEDSGLQRVDPKVMRRLLNDLISREKIKLITAMKPAIKESKRNQTVTIVALPDIAEGSQDVRNLVTSVVNRTLYGPSSNAAAVSCKSRTNEHPYPQASRKRLSGAGLDIVSCEGGEDTLQEECGTEEVVEQELSRLNGTGKTEEINKSDEHARAGVNEEEAIEEVIKTSAQEYTEFDGNCSSIVISGERTICDKTNAGDDGTNPPIDKNEPPNGSRETNSEPQHVLNESRTGSDSGKPADLNSAPVDNMTMSSIAEVDSCSMPTEEQSPCGKIKGDEDEDNDDYVVSDIVGKKITRINKLRAIDYGLLKGKMARVRAFHKTIYIQMRHNQDSVPVDQPVAHHTVDSAMDAPVLGRFTMSNVVANMTVGEYATAIGFYQNHGDLVLSFKDEKISNVQGQLEEEVQGQTSARQILNLVQTLTRLGLVESGGDSQWALSGSGLIRDFGKGMPSGVVPHGIIFTSMKAVDTYWRELEQFARCRMSRRPMHVETEGVEEDMIPSNDIEMRFVSDIYFPTRWASGVVRLQKKDQLIYESMLQLLSGVQLELNLPNSLITTSFKDHPLKHFSVEELEEAFERYKDKIPSLRATQRSMPSHEKLLLYSRYRTKNPIPQWIRERENKIRRQPSAQENVENEFVGDHTCILHLSSKESVVEGLHFRAGITSLGKRPSFSNIMKTRNAIQGPVKVSKKDSTQCASSSIGKDEEKGEDGRTEKDKKNLIARGTSHGEHKDRVTDGMAVDAQRMVHVSKAVIKSRATAYFCNNSQALEWKGVSSMVNWYVRRLYKEELNNDPEMVTVVRLLINAMVKFCDMSMVRAALDTLALKLVILGRFCGEMALPENNKNSSRLGSPQCMEKFVTEWQELDHILFALIVLQSHDLKYSGNVILSEETLKGFTDQESAKRVIQKEFQLDGLIYGREELLSHMLEVMASRFRRVADMHLRENVSHGMLVRCISETETALRERASCCTNYMLRPSALVSQSSNMSTKTAIDKDCEFKTMDIMGKLGPGNEATKADQAEQAHQPTNKSGETHHISVEKTAEGIKSSCGSAKYRRELIEMVVQVVGREQYHMQDSVQSRRLLDKFCWSDIASARDRLLLRGALTYRAERDSGNGFFTATRNVGGNDYLSMLRDEGEVSKGWMSELCSEEAEVRWETSKFRDAVCDIGEASVSSIATNLLTKKMFFENDGLSMMARMSGSGSSKEPIQLFIGRAQNDWTWAVRKKRRIAVRSELKTEIRRRIVCAIGESRHQGRLLTELLEVVKPRSDEDRAAVVWGLHGLLQDGCVRRFVVEQGDVPEEKFAAWHGVLYLGRAYCEDLELQQDSVGKNGTRVAWWRNTNGQCDTQLVGGMRDCILNCLTETPSARDTELVTAVGRRYSGAPRRGALEVAWALRAAGEARVECCVWEGDALTGRWRLAGVGKEAGMVDGLAVFGWRRAWRCAWSVVAGARPSWVGTKEIARLLAEDGVALCQVA